MCKYGEKRTNKLLFALLGIFFAIPSIFTALLSSSAYAAPLDSLEQKLENNYSEETSSPSKTNDTENPESKPEENKDEGLLEKFEQKLEDNYVEKHDNGVGSVCKDQSGAIGWLICPTTGAIAKASDAIYSIIEDILEINPTTVANDSTVHIVWAYTRDITNIVFIIFLLIVVISHLTGLGITNYNLKRILPRLIVVAILVNVSFFICQIAIDVSNILGSGLRGAFYSIEEQAIAQGAAKSISMSWSDVIGAVTTTGVVAGTGIMFTSGLGTLFWALIPILLGAIASVIIGLITISLRQGLVIVLAMIAPLAFVCFLLPNTEGWFKKWKSLFMKMLIFYPMFSFLFGASHIAGWAIITSSVNAEGETSGFGVIVGLAVQIFPLFGSWSLMKMSGTILGTVSDRLHRIAAKPLGAITRASMINRDLAKSKYLGGVPKGLSQEVMQKINNRQVKKMDDMARYNNQSRLRGQAYAANMRNKNGEYTKRAEEFYQLQADSMKYQQQIEKTKNDFNKGLGEIVEGEIARGEINAGARLGSAKLRRLKDLDIQNVEASDRLHFESARAEKISYDNAVSFHDRVEQAFDAHIDAIESGKKIVNNIDNHRQHKYLDYGGLRDAGLNRYETIKQIMDGNTEATYYVKANAASNYASQAKIISSKFQTAFDLTPATQDVYNQIREIATGNDSTKNIDQIVSGLRVVNQRGDTDIVKNLLDDIFANNKIQVGTHASQSLANFLMFDVKDNDPLLRRFGKYINLETAAAFNDGTDTDKIRTQRNITFDEYIKGEFIDHYDENLTPQYHKSKKSAVQLLEGTSLDNVERTFYNNLDASLRKTYADEDGNLSNDAKESFLQKRKDIYNSIAPAFISASLKYPSGSEQLVSAVSFMTGYKLKNGELVERWKDEDDPLFGLDESYFRECSENYLKDQIPSQILGMRTDYRSSLTSHLARAYMAAGHQDEFLQEAREAIGDDELTMEELDQFLRGKKTIVRKNEDGEITHTLTKDDSTESKFNAINNLMLSKAGIRAREIWEKNGTLGQLYKSRKSGAANNAKPFVREWANLDNETEILRYENEKRKKERRARRESNGATGSGNSGSYFTDDEFEAVCAEMDNIYDDNRDNKDDFFNETCDKLEEYGLFIIKRKYRTFHQRNPRASTAELLDNLKGLLLDHENYPNT